MPLIEETALSLARGLFLATVQGSLLMVLAVCVCKLAGGRLSPRLRHALWLLVLLRLCLPDVLPSRLSPWTWLAGATDSAPHSPKPVMHVWHVERTAGGPFAGAPVPAALPPIAAAPSAAFSWTKIMAWIAALGYASIVVGCLGRLFWGGYRAMTGLRSLPLCEDAQVLSLISEGQSAWGVRRQVPVRLGGSGPLAAGLWRPCIVLPPGLLKTLSREQLRAVLWHELGHMKLGHLWLNVLSQVVGCVHWFNPLVPGLIRRLQHSRELVCDAGVLARLHAESRGAYAAALVHVAAFLSRGSATAVPAWSVGMARINEHTLEIEERISMIYRPSASRWVCWTACVGLLVLGLVGLTRAQDAAPPTVAPPAANQPAVPQPALPARVEFTPGAVYPNPVSSTAALPPGQTRKTVEQAHVIADVLPHFLSDPAPNNEAQLRDLLRYLQVYIADRLLVPGTDALNGDVVKIEGDKLILKASVREHEFVATALVRLRAHGLRQIRVQLVIFEGPVAVLDKALQKSAADVSANAHGEAEERVNNATKTSWLLNAADAEAFKQSLQGNSRVNCLSSPTVVMLEGQPAQITTGTERPIVTGFQPDGQADVEFLFAGMEIKLETRFVSSDVMSVALRYDRSEIDEISNIETLTPAGNKGIVQSAQVQTSSLQMKFICEPTQSMLICSNPKSSKPDQTKIILLATVSEVTPEVQAAVPR